MCSTSSLEPVRASKELEMSPSARRGLSVPLQTGKSKGSQRTRSALLRREEGAPAHGAHAQLATLELLAHLDEVTLHVANEFLEDVPQLDDRRQRLVERLGGRAAHPETILGRALLLGCCWPPLGLLQVKGGRVLASFRRVADLSGEPSPRPPRRRRARPPYPRPRRLEQQILPRTRPRSPHPRRRPPLQLHRPSPR